MKQDGLYYAMFNAVRFNAEDNFDLLIKQNFIVGNEMNNRAILSSIHNQYINITYKLFNIKEVKEDLKNNNKEVYKKIEMQKKFINFN